MSDADPRPSTYIQYGCGLSCPDGWLNFDSSPTLFMQRIPLIGRFVRRRGYEPFPRAVRYASVVKGLPVRDGQCTGVYCSHVLEHLALADFRVALRETFRCLGSGGTFRLVLPDFARYVRDYQDSESETPSIGFVLSTARGQDRRRRGIAAVLHALLSGSSHLSMWDERSLAHELRTVGFDGIRRARIGDSRDPRFAEVEAPNRWEGHLGMECTKP
ncbi:MAG: methyltransferase domain-containing protein [Planctomycetota bacterium]|nr:methyltransferase domain-containing protein [Planctomycetota bacterium]